ncbi:DgyrCDS14777 [Dimorphilus gyrociliatus]|uniref:DgyrCDS14777 n=1 Tax=Dimorphilus gyrociliatus TaxID=2664684 RepID=A0A7I8WEU8_9ANNE|nr:DgyrCDS14777 [Dimorphilus gyrociliatus]
MELLFMLIFALIPMVKIAQGLIRNDTQGKFSTDFVWFDGTPLNFHNFDNGENNYMNNEPYVVMETKTGMWLDVPETYSNPGYICEISEIDKSGCRPYWHVLKKYKDPRPSVKFEGPLEICLQDCFSGKLGNCSSISWNIITKQCFIHSTKVFAEDFDKLIFDSTFNIYQWECEGNTAPFCMKESTVIDNLPESSFTASTVNVLDQSQPQQAKVESFKQDNFLGCFRPQNINLFQWLQVDLINLYNITGYHILGGERHGKHTIENHYFLHSLNCLDFSWYNRKETKEIIEMIGHKFWSLARVILFKLPIVLRCFRINPKSWHLTPDFRLSVRGCQLDENISVRDLEGVALGMESGLIDDMQISAKHITTSTTYHYAPFLARLRGRASDYPFQKQCFIPVKSDDWFDVTWSLPIQFYGLSVAPSATSAGYLKKFSLAVAYHIEDMLEKVKNSNGEVLQFSGSIEWQTLTPIQVRLDEPIRARYVRIYSDSVIGSGCALFEFYGKLDAVCPRLDLENNATTTATCPMQQKTTNIYNKTSNSTYKRVESTIVIEFHLLYHLTAVQIQFSNTPIPEWSIDWSRGNNVWRPLDKYTINRLDDDKTFNITLLNLHSATKLQLNFWSLASNFVIPCVEYFVNACEAEACPPNTIEYGESCYQYFPGSIYGSSNDDTNLIRSICRNVVWSSEAYVIEISSIEEDSLAVYLMRRLTSRIFIGLIRNDSIAQTSRMKKLNSNVNWQWTNDARHNFTNFDRDYMTGEPDIPSQYCAFSSNQGWHNVDCSVYSHYICEMKANRKIDAPIIKWFFLHNARLNSAHLAQTYETAQVEGCSYLCQHQTSFKCKGFSFKLKNTDRKCYLYNGTTTSDTNSEPIYDTSHWDTWEMYSIVEGDEKEEALINGPTGISDGNIETDVVLYPTKYGVSQLRMVDRQFYGLSNPMNGGHFRLSSVNSYIKFNFGRIVRMTRINIEGAGGRDNTWIKYFYLDVSNRTDIVNIVKTSKGERRKFFGNINHKSVVQNAFNPYLIAQYAVFYPGIYQGRLALRLEIFGFNYSSGIDVDKFTKPLGLTNLYILHSQMLSEKLFNLDYGIHEIRLGCIPVFQTFGYYISSGKWQFDLGIQHHIVKVISSGQCNGNGYLKSFGVMYTNDLVEWYDHTTNNGEIKKYTVHHSNQLFQLVFHQPIIARYIRFTYTGEYHIVSSITMELYGYPAKHPKLNTTDKFPKIIIASSYKSLATSPKMALNTKDTFWCMSDSDTGAWWFVDFGVIYYIERIFIYYKESLQWDNCNDTLIYGAQYNKTNMNRIEEEITCEYEMNRTVIFSSPALRFRFIRLNFNKRHEECMRFEFFGEKAPVCPPGSVRNLNKCYTTSDVQGTFEACRKFCQNGFSWKGEGNLVMPKTTIEIDFVKRHFVLNKKMYGIYIGAKQTTLDKFVWLDGTKVTNYLTRASNYVPVYTWPCIIARDFFDRSTCNDLAYAMCETLPNLPDDERDYTAEEKCQPIYSLKPNYNPLVSPKAYIDHTYLRTCLDYCLSQQFCFDDKSSRLMPEGNDESEQEFNVTVNIYGAYNHIHVNYLVGSSRTSNVPAVCSLALSTECYLEVNFNRLVRLTAFTTSGRYSFNQYTKTAQIFYKRSSYDQWLAIRDKDGDIINYFIQESSDYYNHIEFAPNIVCESLRFNPTSKNNYASLILQLYGRYLNEDEIPIFTPKCNHPLGIGNTNQMHASQITSPSYTKPYYIYNIKLDSVNCWITNSPPPNDYIQIDLGHVYLVTGFISQSCKNQKYYIYDFSVEYSLYRIHGWKMYEEPLNRKTLYLRSNPTLTRNMKYLLLFNNTIESRFMRFTPKQWLGKKALRLEIIGCIKQQDPVKNPSNELERILIQEDSVQGNSIYWGSLLINENANLACPKHFTQQQQPIKISLNFKTVYTVTGFSIVSNATQLMKLTIQYSINSVDWYNYTNGIDHLQSNSLHQVLLSIPIMAVHVALFIQSESFVCWKISIHCKKYSECPPGYFVFGRKCISHSFSTPATYANSIEQCKGIPWLGEGNLISPKYDEILNVFLQGFFSKNSQKTRMGLTYKTGKYTWPDGSTLPTDEIIRWHTSKGSGSCGGFDILSGFWIKLSCNLDNILISCEKEAILPVNEKIGQLWTVVDAASLNATSSKMVYKSDFNTRFDCLMACNEEIRFICISFAFDTNTKDCILYSSNTYSKNAYLKRDVDDKDKLYFETVYPGKCFQRLIEEKVLGIKWNVSSEYDSSTDKTKLPLHVRKGPEGFWRSSNEDLNPWILFYFDQSLTISSFVLQGTGKLNEPGYVKNFTIESSLNNVDWKNISWDISNNRVFQGLFNHYYARFYTFKTNLITRFLKFNLLDKNLYFAMQIELYGCVEFIADCLSLQSSSNFYVRGADKSAKLKCFGDWTILGQKLSMDGLLPKSWSDYKNGYEDDKEFWAGNQLASYLTNFREYNGRIDMWSKDGSHVHNEFQGILIESESKLYSRTISKFLSGSAQSADFLNTANFYTIDSDNELSCAQNTNSDNVALGKIAFQKTTKGDNKANLAIDGISLSDATLGYCAMGEFTTNPWWVVNLQKVFNVTGITVANRKDCCSSELSNFTIGLSETFDESHFDTSVFRLCKHYTGAIGAGVKQTIDCDDESIKGSYLGIWMVGENLRLTLCEVEINTKTKKMEKAFGENCDSDSNCFEQNTVCIPEKEPYDLDYLPYSCQCSAYTIRKDNNCYRATDILLKEVNFEGEFIREEESIVNLTALLVNNAGWPIIESTLPITNYDFTIYISDSVSSNLTAKWRKNVSLFSEHGLNKELLSRMEKNSSKRGEATISLSVFFNFPKLQCFNKTYICINVLESPYSKYLEWDKANNQICSIFSNFVNCKPDLDLSILKITLLDGQQQFYRSVIQNHTFTITLLNLPSNLHDVIELFDEYFNYDIESVSTSRIEDINSTNPNWKMVELELKQKQNGIKIGNTLNLTIQISTYFSRSQCEGDLYICFRIISSNSSSFTESNRTNDILCIDLTPYKNCTPAVDIEANLTIPRQTIVRGYIQHLQTYLKWTNIDKRFSVENVPFNRNNFNITLFFTDINLEMNDSVQYYKSIVNSSLIQTNLSINCYILMEFINTFKIPRSLCSKYKFLCFKVLPANGSSYSLLHSKNSLSCTNVESYINCLGLTIKDLNLRTVTNNLTEGTISQFSVTWSEGSDVNYIVNFTDRGDSISWNWFKADHVDSFGLIENIIQYNFTEYGIYNVSLTAWNEAGIEICWLIKLVEPILKNHVSIYTEYTPNEPPVQVFFYANYKYVINNETKSILMTCIVETGENFIISKTDILTLSKPLIIDYNYLNDEFRSKAIITCNNSISIITSTRIIKLQQNVIGLNMKFQDRYWSSFENISLELTLKNGSDVEYEISFGDGSTKILKNFLLMANLEPFYVYYSYSMIGEYKAMATARNKFFNCSSETVESVIIQHKIKKIDLIIRYEKPRKVNLTIVEMTIENGFKPTNVSCLLEMGDGNETLLRNVDLTKGTSVLYEYSRMFNKRERRHLTLVANCSNNVSNHSVQKNISLEEEITGLYFSVNNNIIKVNESLNFTLSLSTGVNILAVVDYGDGQSDSKLIDTVYKSNYWIHKYEKAGNFNASVLVRNSVNELTATALPSTIIVQVPIFDLAINGPNISCLDEQPVNFSMRINQHRQSPTNVSCIFQPTNENIIHKFRVSKQPSIIQSHKYEKSDVGKNISVKISCKNLISKFENSLNLLVFEKIKNLSVKIAKPAYEIMENVSLKITVEAGSSVIYKIHHLSSVLLENHPKIFASDQPLLVNLLFYQIGNYSIIVVGENNPSREEQTIKIVVQNRIENIGLKANNSVLWTPGIITYELYSESTQKILKDIYCIFEFSNGESTHEFISNWPPKISFVYQYYFSRNSIGNLTTNVICSNLLSVKNLQSLSEIILDAVTIEQLTANESVLLTNVTTVIAKIGRMATNSCFIFDFGDDKYSTKMAFGVNDICREYAFGESINFTEIAYDQTTIVIDYLYEEIGYYNIKVKGFNHITKDERNFTTTVADWYCYSPNASVPIGYTFQNRPFKVIKSSPVEIPVNISWDCMKTNRILYEWKIFKMDTNSLEFTSNNKTLNLRERQLSYGIYEIQYFLQMFNQPFANNTYKYYLEIIPSPLIVNIDNNNWTTAEFLTNKTFNAEFFSFDPDNDPNEKLKDTYFKWYCRKIGEKLPTNDKHIGVDFLNVPPTLNEFQENGGCFGNGPGFIENGGNGKLTLNTYYMIPNTTYIISVKILSNIEKREATYEQMFYLQPFKRPTLKMSDITTGNTSRDEIEIKGSTLLPGTLYNLIVEGRMMEINNNDYGSVNETFLMNRPPFGGNCNCQPRTGFASITNFEISCRGWQEFKKLKNSSGLKYEYRARPQGRKQSFLLYFSYNQEAVHLMLPVGNPKNGITETVISVIDSIGDQYEYIFDVHVQPPPIPENKLLDLTLDIVSNDNLKLQLNAGNINVANHIGKLNTVLNRNKLSKRIKQDISISLLETSILTTTAADSYKEDVQDKEEIISLMNVNNSSSTLFFCDIISNDDDDDSKIATNLTKTTFNNSSNDKLRNVMTNVVKIIHNVSDELLLEQRVDEQALNVKFEKMSITIEKISSMNIKYNDSDTSKFGSVKLNSFENGNHSCITRTLLISGINPYMWDKSALNVTSSIAEFQIRPCNSILKIEERRKKRSIHIPQTNYSLSLNMKNPYKGFQYVNTTNQSAIHTLNATRNALILTFNLNSDDAISVLIGYNLKPNREMNNASYILPNLNKTCSFNFDQEEDCNEYRRTIMLRPEVNQTVFAVVSCSNCSKQILNYSIQMSYPLCKLWNGNVWQESDSCKVNEETTASKTKFTSNLFGSLGAELELAPNLIDFYTIFNDFTNKLANNAAVFGTICSLFVLFIPLALLVRRLDKRDKLRWTPLPLLDNYKKDTNEYEVHVYTGNQRKGGTKSKVALTCYGSQSITGNRILISQEVVSFNAGSVRSFIMTTNSAIGSIICIKVSLEKDNNSAKEYDPWFLSRIIIIDKVANAWYNFDCDQWLSPIHADCQVERVLIARRNEEIMNVDELFKRNLRQRLTNDHLWVSVGAKRSKSQFTRFQRLTVCFVALFLSMIASCMFYKNSGEAKGHVGLSFGPVTFTVYELYVGLASSVVVFPGLVLITVLFSSKKWKKYTVPLGWIVAILTTIVAAFFTILYSIQWGQEKSLQWLISFLLSFLQSIVLVQPIKNRSIANVISKIHVVKNYEQFWNWMEKNAIPQLYPKTHYNNKNLSTYDLKYTAELNHMRFSSVRLFQKRVKKHQCETIASMKILLKSYKCFGYYSNSASSTGNFSVNWDRFNVNTTHSAFLYSVQERGYLISLGQMADKALNIIFELKNFGWLDRQTRHIQLEVTILNQETVSQAVWSFEFKPFGGIITTVRSDSLNLYRYTGAGGLVRLVFEAIVKLDPTMLAEDHKVFEYITKSICKMFSKDIGAKENLKSEHVNKFTELNNRIDRLEEFIFSSDISKDLEQLKVILVELKLQNISCLTNEMLDSKTYKK